MFKDRKCKIFYKKTRCNRIWKWEFGSVVGNIKNVVSESMSDLVWVSRDESKKAMDYKGHDK